jgi:hypothetical protein
MCSSNETAMNLTFTSSITYLTIYEFNVTAMLSYLLGIWETSNLYVGEKPVPM